MSLRVGTVTPRYFASLTLTPAASTGTTVSSETYTTTSDKKIAGLQTDMLVVVNQVTTSTGLACLGARCNTINTLTIDWLNLSGGTVTPSSQEIRVVAF